MEKKKPFWQIVLNVTVKFMLLHKFERLHMGPLLCVADCMRRRHIVGFKDGSASMNPVLIKRAGYMHEVLHLSAGNSMKGNSAINTRANSHIFVPTTNQGAKVPTLQQVVRSNISIS